MAGRDYSGSVIGGSNVYGISSGSNCSNCIKVTVTVTESCGNSNSTSVLVEVEVTISLTIILQ